MLRDFKLGPLHFTTIFGAEAEHDTPYMTRVTLGRLRLHIFWRGDADPDPHDHPWGFWTFPLQDYLEEVVMPDDEALGFADVFGLDPGVFVSQQVVKRFRLHYRPATHTHRVLGACRETTTADSPVRTWGLTGRPLVTLVWRERESRDWGFLKFRGPDVCWEPWRRYVYEGGKHTMCEPDSPFGVSREAQRDD